MDVPAPEPSRPPDGWRVPLYDPLPEVEALWADLQAAAERVLRSGRYVLGEEVEAFEAEVAAFLGVRHAVGLSSGTDALVIALRALGVGPGDEVVTTPFTFFATPEAISLAGATPVFADVDATTYNLDPDRVAAAITPRTRALLVVHLFGRPAPMEALRDLAARRGLALVEDAAQAFGATHEGRAVGAWGDAAAFSFFPSKNLGGFGDGGLLATDDDRVADAARALRAHGARRKYHNEIVGYNARLDALQAALLRVKLPHVRAANAHRRAAAARYDAALADVPGIRPPAPDPGHVYHQYTVRAMGPDRDRLRRALAALGVETAVYYPVPCHRLPPYAERPATCPVAEQLARDVLSLPMGPHLTASQQEAVVGVLREALIRG